MSEPLIALSGSTLLWIKAFHIASVMAWMAGMLYLPRLFVYHVDAQPGGVQSETFKVMERRLMHGIINPSLVAALVLGLVMLAAQPELLKAGWMHGKLGALFFMFGLHGMISRWRKDFAADRNRHSAKFYRIANEIPAVLMLIIVVLAVVKPF